MTVDPETIVKNYEEGGYCLKIFQATLNIIAHILIGVVVGACIFMAFSFGTPLEPTMLHIVLCTIGYQLVIAEAILSLSADNGWSAVLRFQDKRRAHTILQIIGSVMAIAGTLIILRVERDHAKSMHGIFGSIAIILTILSLVNGLTSLYAHEWRKCCPGNISKITHICFGILAFVSAGLSLCYGLNMDFFREWLQNDDMTNALIGFTAAVTTIIVINPAINFCKKTVAFIKK